MYRFYSPTTNRAFDNIEILEHARHFVRLAIASYGSLPWVYFGYSFKVAPLSKLYNGALTQFSFDCPAWVRTAADMHLPCYRLCAIQL